MLGLVQIVQFPCMLPTVLKGRGSFLRDIMSKAAALVGAGLLWT